MPITTSPEHVAATSAEESALDRGQTEFAVWLLQQGGRHDAIHFVEEETGLDPISASRLVRELALEQGVSTRRHRIWAAAAATTALLLGVLVAFG